MNTISKLREKIALSRRDTVAMLSGATGGLAAPFLAPNGNRAKSLGYSMGGGMLGGALGSSGGGLVGGLLGALAHRPMGGAIAGSLLGGLGGAAYGAHEGYRAANPTFSESVKGMVA